MNPARRWSHVFTDVFEKSDDVVIRALFDLKDSRDRKSRALANFGSVLFRNLAKLGHCLAGQHLDLKPDLEFALFGPDSAHLRPGIAGDHVGKIEATELREKRFCFSLTPRFSVVIGPQGLDRNRFSGFRFSGTRG